MSQEIRNRIDYTVMCIGEFSQRQCHASPEGLPIPQRIRRHGFLKDCYSAEHLLSIEDAIDDLTAVCQKNGGKIT